MAWRHKSKDGRMSAKDHQEFGDYPEQMDPHSTGGRQPFSPIAEEDGEMLEQTQSPNPRPHNTVSPRSSMSPSHSSVSPVSSGSGHSSPRSPTSTHPHLPPPMSQPPPLPSPQHTRLHPSVSAPGSTKSRSSSHAPKHGSKGHVRSHTHHPTGHVTSHPSKSRKPYETHHQIYPTHGPLPAQHSTQLPSQHSSAPYQRVVRSNSLTSYGQIQDGQSNSKHPYETVAPGNMSVVNVNSKVFPTKVYPMVTEISHITNERSSPDQTANEMLNDPGERGSPSGESNPSSTPNSTLGKQTHRQILETIQQTSNVPERTEGGDLHDGGEVPVRGTTKVHMGNVSISVQNAHHSPSPPSNQTAVRSPRLEARKNETEAPIRVLQPPKSSVSSKVAQFNQNGNHSGGATKNDKDTPAGKSKEKSSSKETSPVGVASKTSPNHSNGAERGISPSSSTEELTNINKEGSGANETDSTHQEVPLLKPDPSKSKHTPPSHPHTPHYSHRHGEAPPYIPNPPYVSLSQPSSLVAPQGITQGIVPPSLSQQDHQHIYDRPPDVAYAAAAGVFGRTSGIGYDPTAPRHHISPPHGHPVRHVVPPQGIGYHMTSMHRGLPPGMQFLRGLPRPEHLVHFTKANVSQAHEAAANGDLKGLHRMLTNHEIDIFGYTDHHFTLAHKAALHGRLQVIQFLVDSGLPPTALQIPDDSFTTPAMLAIQGGSVECLQWLVEEGKVPFEVRDTGGETLMHHAAFHGQVKCLEWLLKTVKKRNEQAEIQEILDESGVTPAHFAAQGGHLDCLQLLMDYGYSVVHTDRENQKPLDWADAMGQNICVRYLMMYETCWALSGELTHMAEQLAIAQKENSQLRELLALKDKDHESAISKLLQSHEEKLTKMREHHVDLMASILHMNNHESPTNVGGGASPGSSNKRGVPVRKAPSEPPSNQKRSSTRPPVPPDASKKRRGAKESRDKGEEPSEIDYRTATPQEVLEKQMTTVAQRMNASREARKRGGAGMTRTFSPLTPIIQRMYNKGEEDSSKGDRSSRSQRHSEDQGRRSAPKVKFSKTVTEFPDYSRYDNTPDRPIKSSSPGQSPSHGHHGNITDGTKGESSEHGSRKSSEK